MSQVEEIYGKKISLGKIFYYVKWRGRPESENTWVPAENISNLEELLDAFEKATNEDRTTLHKRKGSFTRNDEVKKVTQIIWNESSNESMGEIEWKSPHLYNSLYPLSVLHDKCPREMCDIYYSLLKFTYTP